MPGRVWGNPRMGGVGGWPGDQMWDWAWLSSLGGIWGGSPHPSAERHTGGGGCLQCPTASPGSMSQAEEAPYPEWEIQIAVEGPELGTVGLVFLCWVIVILHFTVRPEG